MKLDEWVEETWSEDLADDLLLKPSLLDIDSESLMVEHESDRTSEPGRRRRKRRRGRKNESRNDFGHPETSDDGNIGVLFRKRG
jgi:hypothetical protein